MSKKKIIFLSVLFIVFGYFSVWLQNAFSSRGETVAEKLLLRSLAEIVVLFVVIVPMFKLLKISPENIGLKSRCGIRKGISISLPFAVIEIIPAILACNVVNMSDIRFSGFNVFFCVLLYVFFIGVVEELSARGIALHYFSKVFFNTKYPEINAIVFSSLLFTIMHINFSEFNIYMIFYNILYCCWVFIFSFFMSVMMVYSKNIWCVIIVHAFVDFFSYLRFICLPSVAYQYVNAARGLKNLLGLPPASRYDLQEMGIYLFFSLPELVISVHLIRKMKQNNCFGNH